MDQFVVSARKYRPVTFDSVVGQSHITTTLKNAIRTNHLAQAFLFCGPRGVGKTTCARILAKTINCQSLSDDIEACGECESCTSFQNNASFNIHELDAASNNSVEDIRNLIDQVRYPPQTGKYKIYIIDEVHMLSQAAFNAFLKTLEEPPEYAIFILATTEKHKILPTILSRCQIFDFNRIQPQDIAGHLARIAEKESVPAEYEALELIALKADGGLRDALSMFDLNVTFSNGNGLVYKDVVENLHILDYEYYFRITDALLDSQTAQALLVFDEIIRKGFDGHLFLIGLIEHFRDLLVCKDPATVQLFQKSESAKARYLQQSARSGMSFLVSGMSVAGQSDINYKAAKNQRLHVELCLIKLAQLTNILNLADLGAVDETAKKKVDTELTLPAVPTRTASPPANPESEVTVNVAVPAPQPAPKSYGKLKSTVSLNTALPSSSLIAQEPEGKLTNSSRSVEAPPVKVVLPLNQDNLEIVWKQFVELRRQNNFSSIEEITLDRAIQLQGTTIRIALDNDLQLPQIDIVRYDLMNFLRPRLDTPSLDIEARVAPNEVERKPYTPQEKFNYLADKNPHLLQLKTLLGLDTDF